MNAAPLKITLTNLSRLSQIDFNNLGFGQVFTDHILIANYAHQGWQSAEIMPFKDLSFSPATSCFHYGQEIFEGLKAESLPNGKIGIFRPYDNWKRMNQSASRMSMPEIPEEIFIDGLKKLIEIDQAWVPTGEGQSLYIRPFMISTDPSLGVKSSQTYKFLIILSPVGAYFSKPAPLNIIAETHFSRCSRGSTGFAKCAGNYGGTIFPANEANKLGFDQILWLDPYDLKTIQEVGMMNVMFVIDNKIVTPSLQHDTVLKGITRNSVLQIAQDHGYSIEERDLSIDEIFQAHKQGLLKEIFGTGTAAVILYVQSLTYQSQKIDLNTANYQIAPFLKDQLIKLKKGLVEDTHQWLVSV
ncbi:MAG: branched-chain amino acid aminotransferase [Sediminibacterium sp.]|nr:branched-chain amino acid aminotransferase [Sediminibacterium sp.]